uniref:Putative ovule protein n=1 Tax=Solanum chacoense TaxID=4108 RepID=A0A0V0GEI4_SOLCH
MSSAQLWSTSVQYENFNLENLKSSGVEEKAREKQYQLGACKLKSDRGAFLPFQGQALKEGKKWFGSEGFISVNGSDSG